jgi:adenylosuccinate synthase
VHEYNYKGEKIAHFPYNIARKCNSCLPRLQRMETRFNRQQLMPIELKEYIEFIERELKFQ